MLAPGGSPAEGAAAALTRETGVGELFGGFFLASFTLFTACLADPPPAICRGGFRRTATAGVDGTVLFHLQGTDAQTTFGTASTFALGAGAPAEGPATTYRFRIQTQQLALPDLRLWDPDFRLPGPGQATWDRLPGTGFGDGSGYRVLFETPAGGSVWAFPSDGTQLRYDARVLEDSQGDAVVVARRKLHAEGTDVDAVYGSARAAYVSLAGPPPSRGAPCSLQVGTEPASVLSPCPLTDGDLTDPLGPDSPGTASTSTSGAARPSSATVDLGSVRPIALVVVRGCACRVEASDEGSAWSGLGSLGAADSSLVPPRPVRARFVRVATTGSLGALREISVWDGPPAAAGTVAGAATGTASAPEGRPSRRGWAVGAALAAGVMLGGVAAVAALRRRPRR